MANWYLQLVSVRVEVLNFWSPFARSLHCTGAELQAHLCHPVLPIFSPLLWTRSTPRFLPARLQALRLLVLTCHLDGGIRPAVSYCWCSRAMSRPGQHAKSLFPEKWGEDLDLGACFFYLWIKIIKPPPLCCSFGKYKAEEFWNIWKHLIKGTMFWLFPLKVNQQYSSIRWAL